MTHPIDMLSHEHIHILKVVNALGVMADRLRQGEHVEPALFLQSVHFMREFADKCHHAKEEAVLFPAMEARGVPASGCPLAALRSEHVKGRKLVGELEQAAHGLAAGEQHAVSAITDAVNAIGTLYPDHIWKEDEMVFPMTARLFSERDLSDIRRRFDEAEAEFGHDHQSWVAFADTLETRFGQLSND